MGHMNTIQHRRRDKQVQKALWNTCMCLCVGVGLCVCVCVCVYACQYEGTTLYKTHHACSDGLEVITGHWDLLPCVYQ